MPELIVVVPCFNEAARLDTAAFRRFAAAAPSTKFLFVNDGSRDGTLALLQALARENPDAFDCMDLVHNQGKAEAVRQGLLLAIGRRPQLVAFWDADLATPLETIPEFQRIFFDNHDIEMVFGARVQLLGRHVERTLMRHYLGRVFATCVSLLFQVRIYDTQCGAKMFRPTPLLARVLRQKFLSRWIFDVELLVRYLILRGPDAREAQRHIHEHPLTVWRDIGGSKVRPHDFILAFKDLFRIKAAARRMMAAQDQPEPAGAAGDGDGAPLSGEDKRPS